MIAAQSATAPFALLRLSDGSLSYGARKVFEAVNLDLFPGEIVVLVGASAVGKSSLLRCLIGLQQLDCGTVSAPHNPRIALQFQAPVLQPWLDVEGHLQLAQRISRSWERIDDLLELVGLSDRRTARVHELSGGMRTRLAFARALVQSPEILLLDEPYSSLDPPARTRMYELLCKTVRERRIATLLVTHDLFEAAQVAHRVVVLSGHPARLSELGHLDGDTPRNEALLGRADVRALLQRATSELSGAS